MALEINGLDKNFLMLDHLISLSFFSPPFSSNSGSDLAPGVGGIVSDSDQLTSSRADRL
jgi:hypothetical protein